ncbi:DNA-3-methyladenine glycosylase 2 family protein [Priestia megaterium]|uniref:DNA-3-methyladenine glycosylase family protein n=1 Tax=Priestia megaterium TaxID=1404 RepID=UPI002E1EE12E|nr:DNA-3-methyladenine glycosylase 2 family protein [Priestia megaterium]
MTMVHLNISKQQIKELSNLDEKIKQLIKVIGDLSIPLRNNYFNALVRTIVGQQLSAKVAHVINSRLEKVFQNNITPEAILLTPTEELRKVGISARKILYLHDLSNKVLTKEINLEGLENLSNDEVVCTLTKIKGIGNWTAEMFLIFSLGRMNVLSLEDVGLQRSAKWLYGAHKDEDGRKVLENSSKAWSPHYTTACLYLWEAVNRNLISNYKNIEEVFTKDK